MKNSKLFLYALLNSLGIFIYVAGVSWLITNAEKLFGKEQTFWAPLAMILLFVFSAATTGLLFFGRPVYLYINGFKKEGTRLVFYTLSCLCVIVLAVFLCIYLI